MSILRSVLLVLGLLGLAGCSGGSGKTDAGGDGVDGVDGGGDVGDLGGDEGGDAGGDAGGDGDGGVEEVEWIGCFLYPDSSSQKLAECAMIEVPLRHAEPDGPKIEIWVQRLLGTAAERRGQIWFLEGGPGGSGADFAPFFDFFSVIAPQWDLYTLDHRGVGFSERLGCPQESAGSEAGYNITAAEWPDCIQHLQDTWGADLAEFTTTAAATDLGMIIERVRGPDEDVHVFGVSYGTYWAIRYLQIYPDQATGVILDSIAPPGISFYDYDVFMNDIGEDFIEYCKNDALCTSKLGADPWATIGRVFADVVGGSCPEVTAMLGAGSERFYMRLTLATLLMNAAMRQFAPAAVYRIDRCDPDDVAALEKLFTALFSAPGGPSAYQLRMSSGLFNNVGLSELWEDPPLPDPATVAAMVDPLYFSIDLAPRVVALQDLWSAYPQDQYVGNWPSTTIPVLMMNGDLDPQTPPWVAAPAEAHFTGTHHYYYVFPRCAHGLLGQSPVQTPGAQHCGVQMILDFVDDPQTAPGTACLADILPIGFNGDPAYSQWLFGTDDMWENNTRRSIPTPARKPPGFDRAVRRLRGTPPPKFLR